MTREAAAARLQRSLRGVRSAWTSVDAGRGTRWLAYCVAIGIVAGLGAIVFDVLSSFAVHVFLEVLAHWSPPLPGGEQSLFASSLGDRRDLVLMLVPALGGLVSGLLVARMAPEAAGHGTDAAIDAYHRRGGLIRPRVPLVKLFASVVTLGSGGSGGREGPIAQIGAGFGSFFATRLGLDDRSRRVLMAAGMGAGVGSIFRAPLAGALFASEILYSSAEFEPSVLIPSCVSSITAYSTFTLVRGTGTLFRTPELSFGQPIELVAYFVLALALVAYGWMYVRGFYAIHEWFDRWKLSRALKPAVGGLCTGVVALGLLHATGNEDALATMGFGYGVLQHVLDGAATIGPWFLLVVAAGKILTTSTSIGSGGSAGVFGPSMVIGGCVGGAIGLLLHSASPTLAPHPAAFLVVGMAGFFAGVAKTPISSLIMVSEITGSYSLLVPSMWVCALTTVMSRNWNLYSKQVSSRIDSPAHQGELAIEVLREVRVADALEPNQQFAVLHPSDPLHTVLRVASTTTQTTYPVLDDAGRWLGAISLDELRGLIREELPETLVAHDLIIPDVPRLAPDSSLADAQRVFSRVDLDDLPVWDERSAKLVGLLSRRTLTRAYVERMAERTGARDRG